MKIREVILDEEGGMIANSIVFDPAIETSFNFFSKQELGRKGTTKTDGDILKDNVGNPLWYRYETTVPALETESRDFCKRKENKVYFIEEIRQWSQYPTDFEDAAFIDGQYKEFFKSFDRIGQYNLDNAMYNCRHSLVAIKDPADIPDYKKEQWGTYIRDKKAANVRATFSNEVKLSISDEEKMIIKGAALIPMKMIYRNDVGDGSDGYIYFSKATVKQIKENFGMNNAATFEHSINITGQIEMLESFITPDDDKFDAPDGSWIVSYKVLDLELWDLIKSEGTLGFSIEVYLKPKKIIKKNVLN